MKRFLVIAFATFAVLGLAIVAGIAVNGECEYKGGHWVKTNCITRREVHCTGGGKSLLECHVEKRELCDMVCEKP